ncbi:6-phosphogluconolactonase [Candidatus Omnitrophota bacterium]
MQENSNIRVFENKESMSEFSFKAWAELSRESVQEKGIFTVALSGGKTPMGFYQRLSAGREELPWDGTHIFQADERFVPLDHADNNYRMIKETLLDPVGLNTENAHPVPVMAETVKEAADEYQKHIEEFFTSSEIAEPVFDLIMLGIGDDGHTASLFPGEPTLSGTDRLIIPVEDVVTGHARISMTLRVINSAKNIIFLVSGKKKAHIVREILVDPEFVLPAAQVLPEKGNLFFFIDREAAEYLPL